MPGVFPSPQASVPRRFVRNDGFPARPAIKPSFSARPPVGRLFLMRTRTWGFTYMTSTQNGEGVKKHPKYSDKQYRVLGSIKDNAAQEYQSALTGLTAQSRNLALQ